MTHLAYNLGTGEVLTTNHANHLKRWVARHSAQDIAWCKAHGGDLRGYKWVFAHGGNYSDCVAKLTVRRVFPV